MERWRRLAIGAAAGAALLCLGLLLAPILYDLGSLALARWRWAQRGSANYSLVVVQMCNCSATIGLQITVRGGQVVQVEAAAGEAAPGLRTAAGQLDPSRFNHLTVEATFARVGRLLPNKWRHDLSGASHTRIEYDAELGYVRRLEANDPQAPYFFYISVARDLELLAP